MIIVFDIIRRQESQDYINFYVVVSITTTNRYQFNNLLKFILYLFIILIHYFLYQNICAKMYSSFAESRHV